MKDKLPNSLHETMELAFKDMEVISKDPRYELNMDHWHTPQVDKCLVCKAGSIMANTLGLDIEDTPDEISKNEIVWSKLVAVNDVRRFNFISAFYNFYRLEKEISFSDFKNKISDEISDIRAWLIHSFQNEAPYGLAMYPLKYKSEWKKIIGMIKEVEIKMGLYVEPVAEVRELPRKLDKAV